MAVFSGLWDGVYGVPYAAMATTINFGNKHRRLGTLFGKRQGYSAALRELIIQVTGSAAGNTADAHHSRVVATGLIDGPSGGGVRTIETKYDINRATVAGDITRIDAALALSTKPTYATDRSGVGGGAKLGF